MNWIQISMFAVYVLAALVAGTAWRAWLNPDEKNPAGRALVVGENLLLGSIGIVGMMLLLSLLHLYKAPFLWGMVAAQGGWLLVPRVRQHVASLVWRPVRWDLPLVAFAALLFFFIFRNCYFLIDVDSHSTYLFAQKLWLEHGTSIFAQPALDIRVYVPHFNAVPYALGLSVFPRELLFPQLIVVFWTVVALVLVFGYVSYKFNRWYALAAAMLVLFNDHIFFSGANKWVIINSALIGLLFAVSYNFWEASARRDDTRLALALIFLIQLLANKYQLFYVLVLLFILGMMVQDRRLERLRAVAVERPLMLGVVLSAVVCGIWFVKNFCATGAPAFPIFWGQQGPLDWTREMASQFNVVYAGPATPAQLIKYLSYLFVWPGVSPAKIIWLSLIALPFILLISAGRTKMDASRVREIAYWLSASVLILAGICLASFVDPRHYRYGIGVMAVGSIFILHYVLRDVLRLKQGVATLCIVLIGLSGIGVVRQHFGGRPSIQDNIMVLSERLHTGDIEDVVFPADRSAREAALRHPDKFRQAAWDTGVAGANPLSAFFVPSRPQVGLWHTTAVRWDSFADEYRIAADLKSRGIEWVINVDGQNPVFETPEEYAGRAVRFDRFPKVKGYNYNFPKELADVRGAS